MGNIVDFEKYRMKNAVKEEIPFDDIDFQITFTVAKYIYSYMREELEDPLDVITYGASTAELFENEKNRFAAALLEIFGFWNIDIAQEDFVLNDQEFKLFPTVETVCSFVGKRVI